VLAFRSDGQSRADTSPPTGQLHRQYDAHALTIGRGFCRKFPLRVKFAQQIATPAGADQHRRCDAMLTSCRIPSRCNADDRSRFGVDKRGRCRCWTDSAGWEVWSSSCTGATWLGARAGAGAFATRAAHRRPSTGWASGSQPLPSWCWSTVGRAGRRFGAAVRATLDRVAGRLPGGFPECSWQRETPQEPRCEAINSWSAT
jgi:hypothetical protein